MKERRNDDELQEASGHVLYEVRQFNYCDRRLALDFLRDSDPLLYNSLLTAFTIYARSLYLFFYAISPKKDDILASQFYDDPEQWVRNRPPETDILKAIAPLVGKWSAHLTYERLRDAPYWLWIDIHNDVRKVLKCFVSTVPANRIKPALLAFEDDWRWTDNLPPRP